MPQCKYYYYYYLTITTITTIIVLTSTSCSNYLGLCNFEDGTMP